MTGLPRQHPPRYIRCVRGLAAALTLLVPLAPFSARAQDADGVASSVISQETVRIHRSGNRVVQIWWLPFEYWMAVARELKWTPAQISEVRTLFRNYSLLAALDVEIRPDASFDALSTAEIVRRIEIDVNGTRFEVMRQVDRRMQEVAPDLTYLLQTSLAGLGQGLHILPLPNLGKDGEPIIHASRPGHIRTRYRVGAEGEEVEFWWHTPLTAVNGPKRCKSGEVAEASWRFCPWDGSAIPE